MALNQHHFFTSYYISQDNVCPNCLEKDNNEIHNLKNYISENPITNIESISYQTGITVKNLNRFIHMKDFSTLRKELKNNTAL